MIYVFVMFIWVDSAAVPTWTYFDSEACWADALTWHDEGYSVECRTATLASPIKGLPPTTSPRPRARSVIPALPSTRLGRQFTAPRAGGCRPIRRRGIE